MRTTHMRHSTRVPSLGLPFFGIAQEAAARSQVDGVDAPVAGARAAALALTGDTIAKSPKGRMRRGSRPPTPERLVDDATSRVVP